VVIVLTALLFMSCSWLAVAAREGTPLMGMTHMLIDDFSSARSFSSLWHNPSDGTALPPLPRSKADHAVLGTSYSIFVFLLQRFSLSFKALTQTSDLVSGSIELRRRRLEAALCRRAPRI
jgi:hypothetical protein